MKPITFLLFLLSLCSAEKESKHLCSRGKSVERWISNSSTLSLNQSKIDISFYDISIDINFESNTINGSVGVNGFIDNNLPEYIELDFYNNMAVNSILQNNVQVSFLHEQNKIKIPINNIIIQDDNYFSILIKYQGTPQDCGAGGFKFDEHLGRRSSGGGRFVRDAPRPQHRLGRVLLRDGRLRRARRYELHDDVPLRRGGPRPRAARRKLRELFLGESVSALTSADSVADSDADSLAHCRGALVVVRLVVVRKAGDSGRCLDGDPRFSILARCI